MDIIDSRLEHQQYIERHHLDINLHAASLGGFTWSGKHDRLAALAMLVYTSPYRGKLMLAGAPCQASVARRKCDVIVRIQIQIDDDAAL